MTRVILLQGQVEDLMVFLEGELARKPCDHSLERSLSWAQAAGVDTHDFRDALEAHGGYCDCEVAFNLPTEGDLCLADDPSEAPTTNPWLIPESFAAPPGKSYTRFLKAVRSDKGNCYSNDDVLLAPAPQGAKPRKRVRRSVHFFVGLSDGLPNEVGFVSEGPAMTAEAFAKQVRDSGQSEFRQFGAREATFFLSRLETLPSGTPVGTHFMEVTGLTARKSDQLRIHKVF